MPKTKLSAAVKPWRVIGENIRFLLAVRGMTQKELAVSLNVSPATVSGWINGYCPVATDAMFRAAEIFKVTPAQLVTPRDSANCSRLIV